MKHNIRIELEELMWKRRIKTVSQLSEMSGISRQTLYRILKNESDRLDLNTIIRLCEVLDCEINELLVLKKTS